MRKNPESIFRQPIENSEMTLPSPVAVRYLGQMGYLPVYHAMQQMTQHRTATTKDEIWVLEHFSVYTLGMAGEMEHILNPGDIPIYLSNRGGQVTYHGLGQLIVYVLLDLTRRHWGVKRLVHALEQSVIDYLASLNIVAQRRATAPGVYVAERKIAALGLRVQRGCCYHGLSFNIDMDLQPFEGINPCGYAGLQVTQLHDLTTINAISQVQADFLPFVWQNLCVSPTVEASHF
jgi:lipoyl(octanoyl) transferase